MDAKDTAVAPSEQRIVLKTLATVFAIPVIGILNVVFSSIVGARQSVLDRNEVSSIVIGVSLASIIWGSTISIIVATSHSKRPWVVAGAMLALVLSFTPFVTAMLVGN